MKKVDVTGAMFGLLTAIKSVSSDHRGNARWLCECSCGGQTTARLYDLRSGNTTSCGCVKRLGNHRTHGQTGTRLYNIWVDMRDRCERPSSKSYRDYGARGVRICSEWRASFEAFYSWAISNGYQSNLTIDRKNTSGDYEPSNCRWADWITQQNNRRNTLRVSLFGETKTLREWSDDPRCNKTLGALRILYHRRKPLERAFNETVETGVQS